MKHEIKTKRLILKPIEQDDLLGIHEYAIDPSITMMIYFPKENLGETQRFVDVALEEWEKEEPKLREYVVTYQGKIIGGVDLESIDSTKVMEIGWTIHYDYRHQGFAMEAACGLMSCAFRELGTQKIIACCDCRNVGSEALMKKLGMTLADDQRTRTYWKTNEVSGEYKYEISREKWERQNVDI